MVALIESPALQPEQSPFVGEPLSSLLIDSRVLDRRVSGMWMKNEADSQRRGLFFRQISQGSPSLST